MRHQDGTAGHRQFVVPAGQRQRARISFESVRDDAHSDVLPAPLGPRSSVMLPAGNVKRQAVENRPAAAHAHQLVGDQLHPASA